MSVLAYYELPSTANVDEQGNREYHRKWLVRMSSLSDVPPTVWGTGFASISRYDPHPLDSGALALSLDCNPHGDALGWYEVSIRYSSKPFDEGNASGDPTQTDASVTPTSRPWVVTFGATHGTRLLTKDVGTGLPIANSAGQPFDPPPEIPASNLTISITCFKNFATFDPVAKLLAYQDTVNNADVLMSISPATMTVFPKWSLRCNEYKFQMHTEQGSQYWQLDLTIEYKKTGWNPISLLDCGTTYIKSMSLPPQPVLDAQGNPVSSPVPFDGSGGVLNAGAAPVYLDFKGYYDSNFANILA